MIFLSLLSVAITCHRPVPVFHDLTRAIAEAERTERRLMIVVADGSEAEERFDRLVEQLYLPSLRRRAASGLIVVRIDHRQALEATSLEDSLQHDDRVRPASWAERLMPGPSLALVDFTDATSEHYGEVDFVAPLNRDDVLSTHSIRTILTLPPGRWTERLMLYAVRTHPDKPQSAASCRLPLLEEAATSHSAHQAELNYQGHHGWERRFQELLQVLPGDLIPFEVCAESWPGQSAFDAAIECVHSWRQSDGHWNLVSRSNRFFAFDMARGSNGVWYGTGLFAIPRDSAP